MDIPLRHRARAECPIALPEAAVRSGTCFCSAHARGGQITVVGTFVENKAPIAIACIKDREIDINFSRGNFEARKIVLHSQDA